jgi:ribonuclease III
MLEKLEARLGHAFANRELLNIALTHRSYHFENKSTSPGHYERMEFLGDAVLDLVLSESLMSRYPDVEEGTLSKWRASLVNEITLSEMAKTLDLGAYLYLGRSEKRETPRPRLLASAYEAVVAAVYQDSNLETVRALIEREFASKLDRLNRQVEYATDFKTRLQEWSQRRFRSVPDYRLTSSMGPEHAKTFTTEVWINESRFGQGEGQSRKSAEQEAARQALAHIDVMKGEL